MLPPHQQPAQLISVRIPVRRAWLLLWAVPAAFAPCSANPDSASVGGAVLSPGPACSEHVRLQQVALCIPLLQLQGFLLLTEQVHAAGLLSKWNRFGKRKVLPLLK